MIDTFQVTIHLGAQPAPRDRMIRATAHTHGTPLLVHMRLQSTTSGQSCGQAPYTTRKLCFSSICVCGTGRGNIDDIVRASFQFRANPAIEIRTKTAERTASIFLILELCNIAPRSSRANVGAQQKNGRMETSPQIDASMRPLQGRGKGMVC